MIAQQNKAVHHRVETAGGSGQQLQKFNPVSFAREDPLPGIAAPER